MKKEPVGYISVINAKTGETVFKDVITEEDWEEAKRFVVFVDSFKHLIARLKI